MDVEKLIAEIGLAERHFNDIEARYRLLTSTWVLATFAAMGFVLKTDELLFPKEVIIFAIGIASSAGVQLLWIIDLFVYHRLLDANFVEGYRLELNNPDHPQVHRNMLEQFDKAKGVTFSVRFFYSGCSIVPLVFGVVPLLFKYIHAETSLNMFCILVLFIIFIFSSIILFFKSNNKWLSRTIEKLTSKFETTESIN